MACELNPFTKGLEFLSPFEKELANKLLLENAQNVSLGEFIVKKEPEEDSQGTVTQQKEPLYPCLLIQINQMPPLLSSLTTLMSLVVTIISTLLMKTIVIRESFSRRPVHC